MDLNGEIQLSTSSSHSRIGKLVAIHDQNILPNNPPYSDFFIVPSVRQ